MTLPIRHGRDSGFTMLEMLVVMAVLGLIAGLVALRGPAVPPAIDLRAATGELADTLRRAHARAIAANRWVVVVVDAANHRVASAGETSHALPSGIGIGFRGLAGTLDRERLEIGFAPDGSSTGGGIELSSGQRRKQVWVAWLSGRVSVGNAP